MRLGREPPSSPEPKAEKREKVARAFARAEETLREMEILFQRGLYNGAIDRAYYAAFHRPRRPCSPWTWSLPGTRQ